MRWTIFRGTCTCTSRKLRPVLAANPLLAALAAFAAAASPGAAFWAGARLSSSFGEAAIQPAFLPMLAAAVAVSATVAGVSAALLAPGAEALGALVAAAPRSRSTLATGAVIAPVCAAGALVALLLACFALPLAGETGLTLVLLTVGCAALGAAFGEGARTVAAGEPRGAGALAGAALLWLCSGLPHGAPIALGPIGAVGSRWSLPALAALTVVALAVWTAACGVPRRDRAATRGTRARRLPASAWPAIAVVTARRVLRHHELRVHGLTAVVLPLAAVLAARLALGVEGAAATVFCVAVTLTAVALYPPAALGLARAGWWLLASAPRRRAGLFGAAAAGGVAAAAALVVAVAAASMPFGVPAASIYLQLEAGTAFVLGCAALGGAAVPWHADRVLQQLASYAAVLAVVVAAWLAVGRLEQLVDGGTAFGVANGNAMLLLGLGAAAAVSR